MKKSEELQIKLAQLTAKKMTVSMKIANELAKVTRLEALEAERKELEFNIVETRNRVLAERMLEEKEQSPAGEWIDKRYGIKDEKLYFKAFPIKYPPPYTYLKSHMMEAHEAGQKHGADVERGKYALLMGACFTISACSEWIKSAPASISLLKKAIKNLEENEPASDENWPGIVGKVCSITENKDNTVVRIICDGPHYNGFRDNMNLKLTPIKD